MKSQDRQMLSARFPLQRDLRAGYATRTEQDTLSMRARHTHLACERIVSFHSLDDPERLILRDCDEIEAAFGREECLRAVERGSKRVTARAHRDNRKETVGDGHAIETASPGASERCV